MMKTKLVEAEDMHRRTLKINETVRGPDHKDTINARGNLGHVMMLQGDDDGDAQKAAEGRAAVEEALRLLKAPPHSLPEKHEWVVKFKGFISS